MADAKVIDGKAFAMGLRQRVGVGVAELVASGAPKPGLATVLVGADPASQVYVRSKGKLAAELGMASFDHRLPAETIVDILNHYFDCQVTAIKKHGGEVLKYMGDGLLAVFPIDEYVGDDKQVCSNVLEAAHESRASVADMQYPVGDTVERFRFGVALHVGRILYGNIGGGNRLDFTCIGPAVNLAARLEKIASQTKRTIVASEGFAGICRGGWSDLGEFPVAGFAKAARVYGLADETSAA